MASVRTRPLLIALVAILAIALAAGTLNTAVSPGGQGAAAGDDGRIPGDADPSVVDDDEAGRVGFLDLGGELPVVPLPCYPVLNEFRFLASFALVAGVVLYGLYRWKGPLVPYAVVAGLAPPGLLIHALLTACREAEEVRLSLPLSGSLINASGTFGFSGGTDPGTPVVPLTFLGLLAFVLLVAVAMLVVTTGDYERAPSSEPTPADPVALGAIGRAAGRAADRIEDDADLDNAVYRSWKEMTARLEVPNPEASTPGEFATAAVDAGMDPADVDELTSLFEAVRYGTAGPTQDRESRALAALRRIERTYAEGSR